MFSMDMFALVLLEALCTGYVQGYVLSSPPSPVITTPSAPSDRLRLQERQDLATCTNWLFSDNSGYVECPPSETCITAADGPYATCYPTGYQTIPFMTACYAYPTIPVAPDPLALICPYSYPYCGVIAMISSPNTYISLGCALTAFEITAYYTNGAAAATTTSPITSFTSESGSFTPESSSTTPIPLPSPTSSPILSTNGPSSTSSNTAVIGGAVGGAVGGIALVALAILAFICVRRRKRTRGTPPQPPPTAGGIQREFPRDEKKLSVISSPAPQYTPLYAPQEEKPQSQEPEMQAPQYAPQYAPPEERPQTMVADGMPKKTYVSPNC